MFNRRPLPNVLTALRWLCACLFALSLVGCAITPLNSTQQISELSKLIRENDLDGAVKLIQRYSHDLDDRRGLSVAVRVGNADAVRFFAKRIGVDAPLDLDDTTALIDTVTRTPPASRTTVARTLLELGADPYIEDKFGRSAGSLAERRNEGELLDMIDRYAKTSLSLAPSRMLSWLPESKRSATLLASSSISDVPRRSRESSNAGLTESRSSAFLTRAIWLPPNATGDESLAAFRFHADGRGELLRYVPKSRRSEPVQDAQVAWEFERGLLRLFVLSSEFSALCESSEVSAKRVVMTCTDYSRVVSATPAISATSDASFDSAARALLVQPRATSARVSSRQATRSMPEIVPGIQPGCRPKAGAQRVVAGTVRRDTPAGDWYAIHSSSREVFAPLSGMACRPAEAERVAMQLCSRSSKGRCRSVAGCPAGQVSAVAALPGRAGAFVGCDTELRQARRKALETCKASAGCDCSLIAINGQNINIARQPVCGR